jgi:hypothetical protein
VQGLHLGQLLIVLLFIAPTITLLLVPILFEIGVLIRDGFEYEPERLTELQVAFFLFLVMLARRPADALSRSAYGLTRDASAREGMPIISIAALCGCTPRMRFCALSPLEILWQREEAGH